MALLEKPKTDGEYWLKSLEKLDTINTSISNPPASAASNVKITDGTNIVSVEASSADGDATTGNKLKVAAYLEGFNGTTMDRIRSGFSSVVSTILGWLNVANYSKYNATVPTLTDGQLVIDQCDSTGFKRVTAKGVATNIEVTPTVTASAQTVGRVIGGLQTFSNAVLATGDSGILQSIRMSLKIATTATFKMYIFKANPTASTFTDNVAPVINAADVSKLIWSGTFNAADSGLGTHTHYSLDGIGKAFTLTSGTTLYGVVIFSAGTLTFSTTADVQALAIGVI